MRWLIALLVGVALVATAQAQLTTTGAGGSGGGSGPPTCSNTLDFSAACNSQYIAVVI